MLRIPKALKEVWLLKDKCYEETKKMSSREYLDHIHKASASLFKKYHLNSKTVEKI